jgi:anti-sigma factor RsiW
MKHESIREWLALRLYDELDVRDREMLDAHLKTCADCREFASELEAGLGALRAERGAEEIPADWRERLRRSTSVETKRARLSPWWSSVAAFAAGILVATILAHRGGALAPIGEGGDESVQKRVARNDDARELSIYARFHGSTPPPIATTEGQLARLEDYWKR